MFICHFLFCSKWTSRKKAVIESNNAYKTKYNLDDMTEFNYAQKALLPSQQVKLKVKRQCDLGF